MSDPSAVVGRAADLAGGLAVATHEADVSVATRGAGPEAETAHERLRQRLMASGPAHWAAVESVLRNGLTLSRDIASIGKPGAGRSVLVVLLPLAKQITHDLADLDPEAVAAAPEPVYTVDNRCPNCHAGQHMSMYAKESSE